MARVGYVMDYFLAGCNEFLGNVTVMISLQEVPGQHVTHPIKPQGVGFSLEFLSRSNNEITGIRIW